MIGMQMMGSQQYKLYPVNFKSCIIPLGSIAFIREINDNIVQIEDAIGNKFNVEMNINQAHVIYRAAYENAPTA